MALQYSPKIVTDSLVMCLDPSHNKSYPTDLPVKNGLVMWMDAADDTTFSYSSGTTVSQWRDKSGSNNHMVPISAGPTRNAFLNSRKVLAFTTAQTIGSIAFTLETSANTVFVVSRYTSSSTHTNRVLTAYYNNWLLGHWGSQVNKYFAEGWVYLTTVTADTVWRMYMGDWSGSSTDLASFYSNGTELASGITAASAGPKGLGINFQGGEPSACEAAEIIVFNRVLSATERKQVNTYLGQKWGISNTDRSAINLAGGFTNPWLLGVGDGATNNMPTYSPYNKTFVFDGTNDIISYPNALGTFGSYTFSFWARRNVESKMALSAYGNASFYWFGDNSWAYTHGGVFGEKYYNKAVSIPLGSYGHYCVTYDGAAVRIYRNGVFEDSQATTGAAVFNVGLQLGKLGSSVDYMFSGDIANFLMYTRALSAAEVQQNYESQKARFANYIVTSGLVLNLDAGNPYSYAGAGITWIDVSGASSVAEFVGGPAFSSADNGSIYFDGGTAYCAIAPSNNFAWTPSSIGLNNMTIDIWIKTSDSAGGQMILSKPWNGSGEYNYTLYHNGFTIVTGNQTNTLGFSSIATGNWTNLVILVSTTQFGAYVNGVQVYALTNHGITNNAPTGANSQLQLTLMTLFPYGGGGNSGFSVQGNVSSLRMYNKVLSAAEILQNYNATKGRFGL